MLEQLVAYNRAAIWYRSGFKTKSCKKTKTYKVTECTLSWWNQTKIVLPAPLLSTPCILFTILRILPMNTKRETTMERDHHTPENLALPEPLPVNFESIPERLRHYHQWVVWNYAS